MKKIMHYLQFWPFLEALTLILVYFRNFVRSKLSQNKHSGPIRLYKMAFLALEAGHNSFHEEYEWQHISSSPTQYEHLRIFLPQRVYLT